MKKTLIITIVIILGIAMYYAYKSNVSQKSELRESLISLCNSIEIGSLNIDEVSGTFSNYYSEQLPDNGTTSQRLFGMSESRFDTFCVVSYGSEGKVTDSGVSYD